MQSHHLAALSGIAALSAVSSVAHASAIQLTYQAAQGCPSSGEFLQALEARGADVQLEAAARVIRVSIEQTASGYTGQLQVSDEQGTTRARQASAATCPEVANAMAAVGALILDPAEQTTEHAEASAESAVDPSAQSAEPAHAAQPSATAVEAPLARSSAVSAPPTEDEPAPRDFQGASSLGAESRHWKRDVKAGTLHYDLATSTSVHAGATLGLLPNAVVPRLDLTFLTAPFLTLPGGEQTLVGVMPRGRIGLVGPVSTRISGQEVDLIGLGFHMGVCFSPHYNSRGWVLFGCAEYGGTLLSLELGSGANRRKEEHGYANIGLDFTAQYNFTSWFHAGLRVATEAYVGRDPISLGEGLGSFKLGHPITGTASVALGVNF